MARIRTVKPEFWDSPGIETLDPVWRLLFIAMWNWADDTGRGKAEARELMGFVFPRDEDMTVGEFRRGLGEVRRVFGVIFYKVGGRSYYSIPSWEKHQKIDKRSGARWPGPEEGQEFNPETNSLVSVGTGTNSESSAESPPSVRRDSGAGTGEQGNRGTGEQLTANHDSRPKDKKPKKEPSPEQQHINDVAKTGYEAIGKAANFMAVRSIASWCVKERALSAEQFAQACASIHEMGKPITKQTMGQLLDGHFNQPQGRLTFDQQRINNNNQLFQDINQQIGGDMWTQDSSPKQIGQ